MGKPMGHHVASPKIAGLPDPGLILKSISSSAVMLVLIASICSYNIYEAAHWGNTEKVIAYLDGGADINTPNRWGRNYKAFEKMLVDTIEHREREALLYRRAKRDATIPALQAYLKDYPKGKYAKEAQSVKTSQTMWFPQPLRL
jgi:hypothetical protein